MRVTVSYSLAQNFTVKWVRSWSRIYSQDQKEGQWGKYNSGCLLRQKQAWVVNNKLLFNKQLATSDVPRGLVMEFIQCNVFISDLDCGTKDILNKFVSHSKCGGIPDMQGWSAINISLNKLKKLGEPQWWRKWSPVTRGYSPMRQYRLGTAWLSRSWVVKDKGVLVDNK